MGVLVWYRDWGCAGRHGAFGWIAGKVLVGV